MATQLEPSGPPQGGNFKTWGATAEKALSQVTANRGSLTGGIWRRPSSKNSDVRFQSLC